MLDYSSWEYIVQLYPLLNAGIRQKKLIYDKLQPSKETWQCEGKLLRPSWAVFLQFFYEKVFFVFSLQSDDNICEAAQFPFHCEQKPSLAPKFLVWCDFGGSLWTSHTCDVQTQMKCQRGNLILAY